MRWRRSRGCEQDRRNPKGDTNVTEVGVLTLVRGFPVHYRPVSMRFLPTLALVVLLAAACGDDRAPGQAGSDSKFVGGPCADNFECEFTLCQNTPTTPGGTCTSSCSRNEHCSSGSSCVVTTLGWICLVDCSSDADCRTDYSCQSFETAPPPDEGEAPTTDVCAGAL